LFGSPGRHGDTRAFTCERQCNRAADAAATAGYQHYLSS
jgi:hypothetical protein